MAFPRKLIAVSLAVLLTIMDPMTSIAASTSVADSSQIDTPVADYGKGRSLQREMARLGNYGSLISALVAAGKADGRLLRDDPNLIDALASARDPLVRLDRKDHVESRMVPFSKWLREKGVDDVLLRTVALKLLKEENSPDEEFYARVFEFVVFLSLHYFDFLEDPRKVLEASLEDPLPVSQVGQQDTPLRSGGRKGETEVYAAGIFAIFLIFAELVALTTLTVMVIKPEYRDKLVDCLFNKKSCRPALKSFMELLLYTTGVITLCYFVVDKRFCTGAFGSAGTIRAANLYQRAIRTVSVVTDAKIVHKDGCLQLQWEFLLDGDPKDAFRETRIYRRELDDQKGILHATVSPDVTRYLDSDVQDDHTYFYSLALVDIHGNETKRTEEAAVVCPP